MSTLTDFARTLPSSSQLAAEIADWQRVLRQHPDDESLLTQYHQWCCASSGPGGIPDSVVAIAGITASADRDPYVTPDGHFQWVLWREEYADSGVASAHHLRLEVFCRLAWLQLHGRSSNEVCYPNREAAIKDMQEARKEFFAMVRVLGHCVDSARSRSVVRAVDSDEEGV